MRSAYFLGGVALLTALAAAQTGHAQRRAGAPAAPQPAAARAGRAARPAHKRPGEISWRHAPSDQMYAAIDGQHLKTYVEELTAMSRRYRDQGHQFWGRITGTSADEENAQWLLAKLRAIGLTDVREQPL